MTDVGMVDAPVRKTELVVYRYKIKRMFAGSEKYGDCEVCKNPVTDVYQQVQSRRFFRDSDNIASWTHAGCHQLFGHEQCLLGKRP